MIRHHHEVIEDVTIDLFERIYKKAFRELDDMPPEDHIDIKYEDFCKDPEGICQSRSTIILGLTGSRRQNRTLTHIWKARRIIRKNKFELTPRTAGQDQCKTRLLFCALWIRDAEVERWTSFCYVKRHSFHCYVSGRFLTQA